MLILHPASFQGRTGQKIRIRDYSFRECKTLYYPHISRANGIRCAISSYQPENKMLCMVRLYASIFLFLLTFIQDTEGAVLTCIKKQTYQLLTGEKKAVKLAYKRTQGVFLHTPNCEKQKNPALYIWLGHKNLRRFARKYMGRRNFPKRNLTGKISRFSIRSESRIGKRNHSIGSFQKNANFIVSFCLVLMGNILY